MDVSSWLRSLGLGGYAEAFRANDVDAEALLRLTAEDLIALGVISVGHRRKLLAAIAMLKDGTTPAAAESIARAMRPVEPERRQLTVLFCDLFGSTKLAAPRDPEALHELKRAYQATCADVIDRFEGHVARILDDGVLVYFGWPGAHEDDAERAVRAGLELVEAIGRLGPLREMRLRAAVGIATGHVVIGRSARDQDAVTGEPPKLAARLQTIAAPSGVVISEATRRLVGGLFELDELGPQRLEGVAEPVAAWRVAGEGGTEGRFEARQIGGLTPLVGREEEISLLLHRWRQAKDGDGQVVLLSGEPGIGKSRIARELRARIGEEPHVRITNQCSPYHQTSPLRPVIEQVHRAAAFEANDPPAASLAKLEGILARGTQRLDEAVPLVAALLGLSTGDRYRVPELTPQRQKQRTLEVLVDQLEGLSRRQPILMIFEDAQWIDPSTSELLDLTIERIERMPVLLLITHRRSFTPPWRGRHVATLSLAGLSRRQVIAMVASISGSTAVPYDILEQIAERTDGLPLFVEEVTKMVLESGLLVAAGEGDGRAGRLPPLAIPATLQDSLMARLDRLGGMREVAQIAAVIGREFSHELLEALTPLSEPELAATLDQLVAAELIFRRGASPRTSYRFKHALVQEVAYGTLLESRRQRLHAAVARALEERLPDTKEQAPEVLAHHLTEAGLLEAAIPYWHEAGKRAAQRSSNAEAIDHLQRALDLLRRQPDGRERRARELALLTTLGPSLLATRGFAHQSVAQTYLRGRELCEEVGDAGQLVTVLRGLWAFHLVRAELDASRDVALQLIALAEREHSIAYELEAHRPLGQSLFYLGNFAAARHHSARAIALYDPEQHGGHVLCYGSDSRIVSMSYEAWALWFLGYPDQSLLRGEEALVLARRLKHPFTLAQTLADTMYLYPLRGEVERTREAAEEMIVCAEEYGFPYWSSIGAIHLGWALALGGAREPALERLEAGLSAYRRTGASLALPWFLGMFAEAQRAAGRTEAAAQTLDSALAMVERTGEAFYAAELHRLRGALLGEQGADEAAEADLMRALSIAREQQARGWSLRAGTSLARLWSARGRTAEGHEILASVYARFTEGFDTPDLRAAKALLDELA